VTLKWGRSEPKKQGWYLVTLDDTTVMPLYRMEYPKNNFTWKGLCCGSKVTASMKFPKGYVGEKI